MSFVAIAIGGSAALGAGASIYGGSQQADAAKEGAAVQRGTIANASTTLQTGGRDALAYLDPFRAAGLRAGTSLEAALYSPQQRSGQMNEQRIQLEGEVERLQAALPEWSSYKGPRGGEEVFQADDRAAKMKLAEAKSKLDIFNKQASMQQQQGTQPGTGIEASPWYQFQAELLGRTQDRAFAARGLTGSGFEAEERRRGLIELGAGETERQFGRLKGLYDVGANAATVGAGAITGTAQGIANNQVAQGQAEAQGLYGVAGANANMATGIANSATGAMGAGLNYMQFRNLIAANQPAAPRATAARDPVMGTGYG